MNFAIQECTRRQNHRFGAKANAHLRDSPHHTVFCAIGLHHEIIHRLLEQPQVFLVFKAASNGGLVQNTIRLSARCANGRAFGAVQDSKLNAAFIGCDAHGTTQSVHLFDQVALANTANGRVATHLAQGFDIVRQQKCLTTHARSRQSSFGAGMATANDDHIKFLWVKHQITSPSTEGRRCSRRKGPMAKGLDFICIACSMRDPRQSTLALSSAKNSRKHHETKPQTQHSDAPR